MLSKNLDNIDILNLIWKVFRSPGGHLETHFWPFPTKNSKLQFFKYAFVYLYFAWKWQNFFSTSQRKRFPTTKILKNFVLIFSNLQEALQFVPLGDDNAIFHEKSTIAHMPIPMVYGHHGPIWPRRGGDPLIWLTALSTENPWAEYTYCT